MELWNGRWGCGMVGGAVECVVTETIFVQLL